VTTPTTPSTIATLTAADPASPHAGTDIHAVAQLLAVAFDEPVTRWLVPDPGRHQQVMTGLFTLMAGDALASGGRVDVLATPDEQPVAAAIWFDYSTLEGAPASEPDPRFNEVFGQFAHRWHLLDGLMTRNHLAGPHMYLFAIGVHPHHQGNGLGGRLLTHGHQRLDGVPAYLEATGVDSRRLYARHGYHDLGQVQLPDGPTMWRMLATSVAEGAC
jgi:ribosomal protein S18 acetylase RimI-like enzyme